MASFRCDICTKTFTTKSNLTLHINEVHKKLKRYACNRCNYKTSRRHDFHVHQQIHEEREGFQCETCLKKFAHKQSLLRHLKIHTPSTAVQLNDKSIQHNEEPQKRKSEDNKENEIKRRRTDYAKKTVSDEERPGTPEEPIELEEDDSNLDTALETIDPSLRDEYSNNWAAIKDHFYEPKKDKNNMNHAFYTVRWTSQKDSFEFRPYLEHIFSRQTKRFKINYSHSFLLRNKETEDIKFYHASRHNGRVLDFPTTINNYRDFVKFTETIKYEDIWEYARQSRPDTKWTVAAITSTTFFIDRLTNFPIGQFSTPIPQTKGIYTLEKNWQNGRPYSDKLCFFRCLALAEGYTIKSLEKPAKELSKKWNKTDVTLSDLPSLEKLFEISVDVYQYESDYSEEPYLVPLVRSPRKFEKTMQLLLHEHHFCYIHDIDQATQSYGCSKCSKLFSSLDDYNRHERICNGPKTKFNYPGGVYHPPQSALEVLKEEGIDIEQILRDNGVDIAAIFVYPFRATYDFEAYLEPMERVSKRTKYVAKHIPMSVSVCSNVPGFEDPCCFISNSDPQDLINRMGDYLEDISEKSYELLLKDFEAVFNEIENTSDDKERHKEILEKYLKQMPVVSFNGGCYDINLAKPYMIKRFILNEKESYVIKKGNEFISISTPALIFLDITKFIAPGYSYSKYLSAFKIKENKGHFCYEYITSLDKLQETNFPPKKAFHSQLKNEHISDKDYQYCLNVWKENNMKTLRDFLVWYNNKDVGPFIKALAVQSKVFEKSFNLDMLKMGKTIPSLTLKYVFNTKPDDVFFSLINEKHKDLHEEMRSQIVGGPSLIFTLVNKERYCFHMFNNIFILH